MAVAKSRAIDPWKAKRWFPIYGPKYVKNVFIGETPAIENEKVIGREVTISLAAVIGDIKKQSMNVTFKIIGLEGNNALTDLRRFEIASAYIKRQIRKGRDRVDDSFKVSTSDKKQIVVKPFFVTKNKVNNSKKTLLRKLARQELRDYAANVTYGEIVQDLISTKLQKMLGNSLRKICPLRSSDIRVMEIIMEPQAAEVPQEKTEAKEEAKEELPAEKKAKKKSAEKEESPEAEASEPKPKKQRKQKAPEQPA